ncbi:MAG TPA: hypothetical protein VH247_15640 [Thermoleophilaceae bacterium]|nr:hypothetical protein [Thermoleophilaceae bacterium]
MSGFNTGSEKKILAHSADGEAPWVLEEWRRVSDGVRFIGVRQPSESAGAASVFALARGSDVSHSLTTVPKRTGEDEQQTVLYGATTPNIETVSLRADGGEEFTISTVPVGDEQTRAFALAAPDSADGTLVGYGSDGREVYRKRIDDRRTETLDRVIRMARTDVARVASGDIDGSTWQFGVGWFEGQMYARIETFDADNNRSSGSAPDIRELHNSEVFRIVHGHSSSDLNIVAGLVRPNVMKIVGRTDDDRPIPGTVASRSDFPSNFFVVASASPVVEVQAYDDNDRQIRSELWPPRPEAPTA